jgi:DNA polymerase-3 subunit epsilon
MRQIILDTETTGLSTEQGHRIIEIGCVELVNRKLTGRHFHQYINPERDIDAGAVAVHGMTAESLLDKPVFSLVAEKFMEFVGHAELIIHNAPFDIGFLDYELKLLKKSWKPMTYYCRVIDTLALARQLHVGQRNSLDALCKRYNVDNSQREYHGALLDAHLLSRVFLAMTGGQATLFGDQETKDTSTNHFSEAAATTAQQYHLTVLKANPQELTAHLERLHLMADKGKCLWLETSSLTSA